MRVYIPYLLSIFLSVIAVPIDQNVAYELVEVESFSDGLSKRQSLSVTQNQLGLCRPVTVIFARGTIELGSVGSLVGPPFFNALGAVSTHGVFHCSCGTVECELAYIGGANALNIFLWGDNPRKSNADLSIFNRRLVRIISVCKGSNILLQS